MMSFTIVGTSLASPNAAIVPSSIEFGSIPCGNVSAINSSAVICSDLEVSSTNGWASSVVYLQIAGASVQSSTVFRPVGKPRVAGILPSLLNTGGGTQVTVSGSDLGFSSAMEDVQSVLIGGQECTGVVIASSESLQCNAPPGAGTDLDVVVINALGLASTGGNGIVSYQPPRIQRVEPRYAIAGNVDFEFIVYGTNFGSPNGGTVPSSVIIGGQECPQVELLSSTAAKCLGLSGYKGWPSQVVSLAVGGQSDIQVSENLFVAYDEPNVIAVHPATGDTSGGYNITITGTSFGESSSDLSAIMIGNYACTLVRVLSSREAICTVPPGVGASLSVEVVSRGEITSSGGPTFSYSTPRLVSVTPGRTLTATGMYSDFFIRGTNLGAIAAPGTEANGGTCAMNGTILSATEQSLGNANETNVSDWMLHRKIVDLSSYLASAPDEACTIPPSEVTVGGRPCGSIRILNSSALVCLNVSADGWKSPAVIADVGGQQAVEFNLLEVEQAPIVTGVRPASGKTTGNDTIVVTGLGLGNGMHELHPEHPISVGGRPCLESTFVSPTSLRCAIPPGIGSQRDVVVTNVLGERSPVATLFSYNFPSVANVYPSHAMTAPPDGMLSTGNVSLSRLLSF